MQLNTKLPCILDPFKPIQFRFDNIVLNWTDYTPDLIILNDDGSVTEGFICMLTKRGYTYNGIPLSSWLTHKQIYDPPRGKFIIEPYDPEIFHIANEVNYCNFQHLNNYILIYNDLEYHVSDDEVTVIPTKEYIFNHV